MKLRQILTNLIMATVFDVAAYILEKKGTVTVFKLQKLVYYSQAWSLVWDDEPLFDEEIEAWSTGPVCRDLYLQHKGKFVITTIDTGNTSALDANQKDTVDVVLNSYGYKSPQWLGDLARLEAPWLNARKGVPNGERGDSVISKLSMAEYYESLTDDESLDHPSNTEER